MEDRRSVYWKAPPPSISNYEAYWTEKLSSRQKELVKYKQAPKDWSPDRPSPIWKVPATALTYPEKKRLAELAKHKLCHPNYTPMRSVYTQVSRAAQQAQPTERLVELSMCKNRCQGQAPCMTDSWDWGDVVKKKTNDDFCSARIEQLAEPKVTHSAFKGNRNGIWQVSLAAKTATPSSRAEELSRPKKRESLDHDYNPYEVSLAARRAVPSPRIDQLSQPVPRKVKQKK